MEFLELIKTVQSVIPAEYAWVSKAISDGFPWLTLAMAIFLCFFGYKVQRLWSVVLFFGIGFLAGLITGVFLMVAVPNLNEWVLFSLPLVLGVLGALFSGRLRKIEHFLVNATLVYATLPGILSQWLPDNAAVLLGLAAAVIVGIVAVKYKYMVTIVTTAVSGAITAATMILALLQVNSFVLLIVLELLLAAAGLVAQAMMKRQEHRKAHERAQMSA